MKTKLFLASQERALLYMIAFILCFWGGKRYFLRLQTPDYSHIHPLPYADPPKLDLNQCEVQQLQQLPGIYPTLAKRIVSFRSSLGGFREVKQLKKVYGLNDKLFARIQENLCVDSLDMSRSNIRSNPPTKKKPRDKIDINHASMDQLKSLPGIGSVLAKRILNYRKAIGGFSEIQQLRTVYQLSEENFAKALPYLVVSPFKQPADPKPQELNQASEEDLMRLPGIGATLARRILRYKKLIGFFYKKEQLTSIYGLSEQNFRRMSPFLFTKVPLQDSKKYLIHVKAYQLAYYPSMNKECARKLLGFLRKNPGKATWQGISSLSCIGPEQMEELKVYFVLEKGG